MAGDVLDRHAAGTADLAQRVEPSGIEQVEVLGVVVLVGRHGDQHRGARDAQALGDRGRGIRQETDRCTFLLLDRRYTTPPWRRFLPSGPYNLSQPAATIKTFYRPVPPPDETAWDPALIAACQGTLDPERGEA